MDISNPKRGQKQRFFDHLPPLIVHVVIQCPPAHQLSKRGEFQGPNQNKAQRIGARLSKAEFQPGELKLARQNLAQLTDQAWACLGLKWTRKT